MTHVHRLFDLTGKKALVTGGASGIGYTMSEALAEAGASVAICGRGRHGDLDEAAVRLKKIATEAIALKCDVGVESDILQLMNRLEEINFHILSLQDNSKKFHF